MLFVAHRAEAATKDGGDAGCPQAQARQAVDVGQVAAGIGAGPETGRRFRLPGEKGFALAQEQRAHGVALHAGIMEALQPWAQKLNVEAPQAL